MKLLMHACCAPCSVYCVDSLRKEGIEPTMFWYNPNIHPYMEYRNRREALVEYSKMMNLECVFDDEYGLDEFCKNTIDKLNTRCQDYCYPVRLRKAFEYAKENGYDAVTSTLLYSIYQKHDIIKKQMEELSKEFEIEFLYRDFREGWRYGQDKARELGLYMQKYCGCVFSEEDRYKDKIEKDKKRFGIIE
ncbi:MAG: epoxyqueuosine reductase QueH [Bacilli bacterium]|nr:epoxyqueuosine reductase QueH [Bacilli bacterium]